MERKVLAVLGVTVVMSCLFIALTSGAQEKEKILIASFENQSELRKIKFSHAVGEIDSVFVTEGRYGLKVEFDGDVDWPGFSLFKEEFGFPKDWSKFNTIIFDVYNPQEKAILLGVRIDDPQRLKGGVTTLRFGLFWIPAKSKKTIGFFVEIPSPSDRKLLEDIWGGEAYVLPKGILKPTGKGLPDEIDITQIKRICIYLERPKEDYTLYFDNFRLISVPMKLEGMVDRFGQYNYADWKGKVYSEEDLIRQKKEEEEYLKKLSLPEDRDEDYGGWIKGPKLKSTGFFRVEKVNGKWWFVTPKGHLFWSLGMCSMFHSPIFLQWTRFEGREKLFSWLPKEGEPFYPTITMVRDGRQWINFLELNLIRKYGEDYRTKWIKMTKERYKKWGFNTIGVWSLIQHGRGIPYIINLAPIGRLPLLPGQPAGAWVLKDVFHPDVPRILHETFCNWVWQFAYDPHLIGYTFDAELSWNKVNELVLKADKKCYSKVEFVSLLKRRYGTIEELNASWGTNFTSWDEFLKNPVKLPTTDSGKKDLSDFLFHYAKKYFSLVRDAIKTYDPNHLYLGAHFTFLYDKTPDEVVKASALYCDVISINYYWHSPEWHGFPHIKEVVKKYKIDKPILITEFSFLAIDRGFVAPSTTPPTYTQEDRAKYYQIYIKELFDTPWSVGAHWFAYTDEAFTGSPVGVEAFNLGFISVTDTPHYELVESAREINYEIYNIRGKGKKFKIKEE